MSKQLLQEVEDLKAVVDQILIQTALNSVRINVHKTALFAICQELLPDEAYKNLCANYLSELKQSTDEALAGLEDVLFEPGGKVLKLKMDNHFQIEQMKRDLGISD